MYERRACELRITACGDSHHCFGAPIAAISRLVDAALRTGARDLQRFEPEGLGSGRKLFEGCGQYSSSGLILASESD
jgi:hypothetical protein